jgi:hypothetical protein
MNGGDLKDRMLSNIGISIINYHRGFWSILLPSFQTATLTSFPILLFHVH